MATAGFDVMRKPTRRQRFLQMMDKVMPWQELMSLVEPFYPKGDGPGRPVKPLIWMLKLYFLQIWYKLSDPQTEELMHDSHAVQEFLGLDLGKDAPPDETTICRFRQLLEDHGLGPKIFELVNRHLAKYGIGVHRGTIVDATVIKAPTSTKNQSKSREPEMGSKSLGIMKDMFDWRKQPVLRICKNLQRVFAVAASSTLIFIIMCCFGGHER